MEKAAFESWLDLISALSVPQRRQALQALLLSETSEGHDDDADTPVDLANANFGLGMACAVPATIPLPPTLPSNRVRTEGVAELGQRRGDSIGCPHCEGRAVVLWGRASALPRYRCKACRRTFNALTKTPLAHLRLKNKWATQAEAMIEGVSTAKAAK
jgi:hypothetical protein